MSADCGPINVQILDKDHTNVNVCESGSTTVQVQPFSVSAVKHATTHYISGNDPINHNYLSGLQGGESGNYYHLSQASFELLNGISNFYTDIPSGVEEIFVPFLKTYSQPPVVVSNLLSPYSYTYLTSISSVTTTGFNILFSHQINNTGFKLLNVIYSI